MQGRKNAGGRGWVAGWAWIGDAPTSGANRAGNYAGGSGARQSCGAAARCGGSTDLCRALTKGVGVLHSTAPLACAQTAAQEGGPTCGALPPCPPPARLPCARCHGARQQQQAEAAHRDADKSNARCVHSPRRQRQRRQQRGVQQLELPTLGRQKRDGGLPGAQALDAGVALRGAERAATRVPSAAQAGDGVLPGSSQDNA